MATQTLGMKFILELHFDTCNTSFYIHSHSLALPNRENFNPAMVQKLHKDIWKIKQL